MDVHPRRLGDVGGDDVEQMDKGHTERLFTASLNTEVSVKLGSHDKQLFIIQGI